MAKGIDVAITRNAGGGTPVTYSLERQIDGGGYSVIDGSITFTSSPQTYSDTNGGSGFSDGAVVDYRATATNTDGTSSLSSVEQITISGAAATLIYQSDITADGISDFTNTTTSVISQSGNNLRIDKIVGATVTAGFNILNNKFIPPHNVNWLVDDTFTIECDIAVIGGAINRTFLVNISDAIVTSAAPYTEDGYVPVTGKTNGSLGDCGFRIDSGTPWEDTDYVEISEVRIYKL